MRRRRPPSGRCADDRSTARPPAVPPVLRARPLGDFNVRWLKALFRPIRPIKDFLHGKWLGHSVHGALTDAPIGALTLAIIFDALDLRAAADIWPGVGVLARAGGGPAGAGA